MLAATSQQTVRTARQHVHRAGISLLQGMNLERPQNASRERGLANSVYQGGRRRAVSGSCFPEAPKLLLPIAVWQAQLAHSAFTTAGSRGSQWCGGMWARGWGLVRILGLNKAISQKADCINRVCAHLEFSPQLYSCHCKFRNVNLSQQFRNQRYPDLCVKLVIVFQCDP